MENAISKGCFMDQEQSNQDEKQLSKAEEMIAGAIKVLEDLVANAKSPYVRKQATKKLQQIKDSQEQ
jgi:hypothetical protein